MAFAGLWARWRVPEGVSLLGSLAEASRVGPRPCAGRA